ncbi:MAG TPA: hypothetical protein VN520_10820 [Streptomyces sp.]|uniref:hypothetical protein n=1 Tax=Streptomyces sp. TaxID=1931 RepID=UPI002CEBE02B|nr:hypothetical protein [Streptomyces sp.]HWU06857.1 hypothetical protein [Streptomyces sp.]
MSRRHAPWSTGRFPRAVTGSAGQVLDATVRDRTRGRFEDLRRGAGTTTVHVAHDRAEAVSLSDRVAVFMCGCLQQAGAPTEIHEAPPPRRPRASPAGASSWKAAPARPRAAPYRWNPAGRSSS